MSLKDIAGVIADAHGLSKASAEAIVKTVCGSIATEVANLGECRIAGIGTLATVDRAARTGRNPRTGKAIEIPARRDVKFRPAQALREQLNRVPAAARKRA